MSARDFLSDGGQAAILAVGESISLPTLGIFNHLDLVGLTPPLTYEGHPYLELGFGGMRLSFAGHTVTLRLRSSVASLSGCGIQQPLSFEVQFLNPALLSPPSQVTGQQ